MKQLYLLLPVLFSLQAYTQNLIPNGSFEDFTKCPQGAASYKQLGTSQWYPATGGTPDYFNRCSKIMGVPLNKQGEQNARTGNAYTGIIAYDKAAEDESFNLREYLQVKLDSALLKDTLYCIKFYVSLSDYSNYAISSERFGMYLSADFSMEFKSIGDPLPFTPQVIMETEQVMLNDSSWVEISGVYKAVGNEQYVTIGNFAGPKKNKVVKRKSPSGNPKFGSNYAYYYIDDVSIVSVNTFIECHTPQENEPVILKGISFNNNQSTLLPTSYPELNKLIDYLKTNPTVAIEISGHTDNTGNNMSNIKLSAARAKAVADYLTEKGISPTRISSQGYGSSKPVAPNNTEENRKKNRRVEVILR